MYFSQVCGCMAFTRSLSYKSFKLQLIGFCTTWKNYRKTIIFFSEKVSRTVSFRWHFKNCSLIDAIVCLLEKSAHSDEHDSSFFVVDHRGDFLQSRQQNSVQNHCEHPCLHLLHGLEWSNEVTIQICRMWIKKEFLQINHDLIAFLTDHQGCRFRPDRVFLSSFALLLHSIPPICYFVVFCVSYYITCRVSMPDRRLKFATLQIIIFDLQENSTILK